MNSATAPLSRKSVRFYRAVLVTGILTVLGLLVAVAEWGSTQQVSMGTGEYSVSSGLSHVVLDTTPACGKRDPGAADPIAPLAAPPRAAGDQLITPVTSMVPEFTPQQRLSIDARPRAPAVPVAAPHLTTVLII
ncbi:hypothetical protein [Nocardia inohanensis]|uniref:hypothetical protein n=1 Tax=Nocardia inohanensis TaxID=209246 RepID=UPI00082B52A3|nr:hypothetical protein [Nocardia inohanensis]